MAIVEGDVVDPQRGPPVVAHLAGSPPETTVAYPVAASRRRSAIIARTMMIATTTRGCSTARLTAPGISWPTESPLPSGMAASPSTNCVTANTTADH